MNIEINKWRIFTFSAIILIIIYVGVGKYFDKDIKTNRRYLIATLTKIEYIGRSATNDAVFKYDYHSKSKKGTYGFPDDSSRYYESQIGKRFLVKISDKQWVNQLFFTYELYMNKPVPDSIEAPPEGWEELPEWAK